MLNYFYQKRNILNIVIIYMEVEEKTETSQICVIIDLLLNNN